MDIIIAGIIGGSLATMIYATVLRFDLRIAPALVAVQLIVGFAAEAAQKQTAQGAMLAVVSAAAVLALASGATRYLLRPDTRLSTATVID